MTGKIYFILGSTFFMGMFVGFFLYVTVYAPEYDNGIPELDEITADTIVIEGQMYGGCQRGDSCASFRLLDNRSYNYLSSPDADAVSKKLSTTLAEQVFDVIGTTQFFTDTRDISPQSCASFVDGTDYTYTVSLGEDIYTLDTCDTLFAQDARFQSLLLEVWAFMDNPEKVYPEVLEKGVGGILKDRFENSGQ